MFSVGIFIWNTMYFLYNKLAFRCADRFFKAGDACASWHQRWMNSKQTVDTFCTSCFQLKVWCENRFREFFCDFVPLYISCCCFSFIPIWQESGGRLERPLWFWRITSTAVIKTRQRCCVQVFRLSVVPSSPSTLTFIFVREVRSFLAANAAISFLSFLQRLFST